MAVAESYAYCIDLRCELIGAFKANKLVPRKSIFREAYYLLSKPLAHQGHR